MKRIHSISCMVLLVSLWWTLPIQAAEPIKIGHINSMSGGTGQLCGIPDLTGVKMAVEEINQAGGILGRPLKVISRDDKLSPEVGVRQAKDLILNEKVHWIQGMVSSAVGLAVSAFGKENKVIVIVTNAASQSLTEEKGHRYIFHTNTNTVCYARVMANGVVKFWPGLKKVFTLCPDYEYGHQMQKQFMEAYTKLVPDARIVGELWPKLGTQDFTPYVAKIMGSGCDLLYTATWGGDMTSFTKTAWPFGLFKKIKVVGENWGLTDYLSPMFNMEENPEGGLGGSHYPFWLIDNPLSNAFWPKFKKVAGQNPGACAPMGYATVFYMKKAIEKAGSLETEKIIDAAEGLEFDSVFGRLKIRECDHQTTLPFWVGIITKDAKAPAPPLSIQDIILLNPEECTHTCSEAMAARQKQ